MKRSHLARILSPIQETASWPDRYSLLFTESVRLGSLIDFGYMDLKTTDEVLFEERYRMLPHSSEPSGHEHEQLSLVLVCFQFLQGRKHRHTANFLLIRFCRSHSIRSCFLPRRAAWFESQKSFEVFHIRRPIQSLQSQRLDNYMVMLFVIGSCSF
jgi:hypothetical protein